MPASSKSSTFRFFPKNIVGAVFNFYGPRPGRLAKYLRATVPGACPPETTVDTLVNPDILSRLDQLQDLRLLQLHVRASYMDRLRQAQTTLGNALRGTLNVADAESVEIVLRSNPRSGGLGKELLRFVRKLARRSDLKAGVKKLKVRGKLESGRIELVDVLSDDLLVRRRLPLARIAAAPSTIAPPTMRSLRLTRSSVRTCSWHPRQPSRAIVTMRPRT